MTTPTLYSEVAAALHDNGYKPVPIKPRTKRPPMDAWQTYTYDAAAVFPGHGCGLILGDVVGVDIDVRDPVHVEALVQMLGEVVPDFADTGAPRRIGAAPKSLYLFRASAPFSKIATAAYVLPGDASGDKAHKVEVLAAGQQFVAYGVHPDTEAPYVWNGAGEPTSVPIGLLPSLSETHAREYVRRAGDYLASVGERVGGGAVASPRGEANPEQRAADPAEAFAALSAIPADDRDTWIRAGHAFKGAVGDGGLEQFLRWSATSDKYVEADARERWAGFNPDHIGMAALVGMARDHGWQREYTAELIEDQATEAGHFQSGGDDNELAMADQLAAVSANQLRYAVALGWLTLNDAETHWVPDNKLLHFDAAKRVVHRVSEPQKAHVRKAMRKSNVIAAVANLARSDPRLICAPDEFDSLPYELNTPAGVIDLRSGTMRTRRPGEMFRRCTAVSPSSESPASFLKFLEQVFPNASFRKYVQKALGACLFDSRISADHWFLFLQGVRRAGKNTLAEFLLYVLGNYAGAVPTQIFTEKGGNEHPTLYATLEGLRLAVASETSDGERFNAAVLKQLTGDAQIAGRTMRTDYRQMPRTFRLMLQGNEQPAFDGGDAALVFRLHLVPFTISFANHVDVDLPRKLRAGGGAERFLGWLITGAKLYADAGLRLDKHTTVERASVEYAAEMDDIGLWLAEQVTTAPFRTGGAAKARAGALYEDFRAWKLARGGYPVSMTRWGNRMEQKGHLKDTSNGVWYRGLRLA